MVEGYRKLREEAQQREEESQKKKGLNTLGALLISSCWEKRFRNWQYIHTYINAQTRTLIIPLWLLVYTTPSLTATVTFRVRLLNNNKQKSTHTSVHAPHAYRYFHRYMAPCSPKTRLMILKISRTQVNSRTQCYKQQPNQFCMAPLASTPTKRSTSPGNMKIFERKNAPSRVHGTQRRVERQMRLQSTWDPPQKNSQQNIFVLWYFQYFLCPFYFLFFLLLLLFFSLLGPSVVTGPSNLHFLFASQSPPLFCSSSNSSNYFLLLVNPFTLLSTISSSLSIHLPILFLLSHLHPNSPLPSPISSLSAPLLPLHLPFPPPYSSYIHLLLLLMLYSPP